MAGNIPIKLYCYVFGTRSKTLRAGGQETEFYQGGDPDYVFANLSDIKFKAKRTTSLSAGKAAYAGMEDMASFTGVPYKNETGMLYYYVRRAMHTDADQRESSYGQIVIFKQEDLFVGDNFINNVLGYRFLAEDEMRGMDPQNKAQAGDGATFILSDEEKYEMVKQLEDVPAVNLRDLSAERRNCLCKVAELLLRGKKVMLRLPEGRRFVSLCNEVMLELFTLLPDVARPCISFSTCRREGDFERLRDIQLLIVDKAVKNSSDYTLVDLDAHAEDVSPWMEQWCLEAEANRLQINYALTSYEYKPQDCCDSIRAYYDPENRWWEEDKLKRRFESFEELKEAVSSLPVLWTRDNWEAFCCSLKDMIHYEKSEQYDGDEFGIKQMLMDVFFYDEHEEADEVMPVDESEYEDRAEWLELVKRREFGNGFYQMGLSDAEIEEVQEEIMITNETLRRVQEQKEQFDTTLEEVQEAYSSAIEQQQEAYASAVEEQQAQFNAALLEQEKAHAEELDKQRAAYKSAVSQQNEAIEAQRKAFKSAVERQNEAIETQRQEEEEARRKDREELYARLDKIGQGIEESQQKLDGKMDTLTASIDGKISAVREQIRTENSQMEERLRKSVEENQTRQSEKMEARITKLDSAVRQGISRKDLEERMNDLRAEQDERLKKLDKKLSNVNHAEDGSGASGGGSNMAMGLAVAGCVIGLILVVLLVIGIVKFKPAMEYAKTEAEATDTPKPTAVPAPTDTPEPTFTPIPEVIPYERGKYVTVCNNFALILTEEGEGYWVYSNDLVSVKIRVRTAEEEVQEGEIPASDGKYILTVMKNAGIQTVTDETEATSETEISTPEVVNEEANRLYEAVTQALYEAAGFTPTPKPVEGSAIWARKLLGLSEEVELSAVDTMNLSEELVALFGDKLEGTNTYLLKAGDVYLVLSKTEDLFEIVMAEADAYMEAEAEAEVDETEGDVEEEKLKVNCFKIIKIENSQYTLYIFAEDINAVEALFPTVVVEAAAEAEGTEPTAPAAEPSASPAA